MKHLTWFCIRHDILPGLPWLRRTMLRSIFKPISAEAREYGAEIDGWYDLGTGATPEMAERVKLWHQESFDG